MRQAVVHVVGSPLMDGRQRLMLRPVVLLLAMASLGAGVWFVATQVSPSIAQAAVEGWRPSGVTQTDRTASMREALPVGLEGALPLFACRAVINRDVHVGRIRTDFGGCHIGFGGKEVEITPFETLSAMWNSEGDLSGAFLGGSERAQISASSSPFSVVRSFVCRAPYQGGVHPGEVRPGEKGCAFGFGGRQMVASAYEVLQSAPWLMWARATARNLPTTAVVAGNEGGETFYACRAADPAGLHPGKIKRNGPGCSIASDGHEVIVERFEVLSSRWIAGREGMLPVSAIPAGWETGRPQYLCRGQTPDGTEIGKVNEALGGCHVGMLGREVVIEEYEVLSQ